MDQLQATGTTTRKRKAENQDNERLSKRLSLLNLERNGEKLYVPVEHSTPTSVAAKPHKFPPRALHQDDDVMQLDNTKHKVYIYDLDAELSDSESDDGKLIFLPDIQKHLRETRIPPSILANSDGELAGNNQLILYNIPSSLTVPEDKDSVRKAIIETRARARAQHEQKRDPKTRDAQTMATGNNGNLDARDWFTGMVNGHATASMGASGASGLMDADLSSSQAMMEDDPDAMDLG